MIIVRVKGFAGDSSRNGVNIFKSYTLGDPSVVGKPARVPSAKESFLVWNWGPCAQSRCAVSECAEISVQYTGLVPSHRAQPNRFCGLSAARAACFRISRPEAHREAGNARRRHLIANKDFHLDAWRASSPLWR